ncbi:hypothetical protein BC936DRAFT_148411 [Jimgerdemannia flammicorona]|uniref:Uncharacterized protein n=1 Tax=Jimgerdemannia flammicorona TaxID=994334 RepID=A0A433DKI7_9FUNG|nr:hypothetical protein BC936DRAFT_148411 [Jimgerdemannia flammicorona]
MDEILLKIQGAETDTESPHHPTCFTIFHTQSRHQIMQAYTVGADTLKAILASTGLTVDSIDETMNRLRDVLGDQQEIDNAMRLATDGMVETIIGPDADEELERELEGLVDAEKAKTQEAVESSVPTSEVTRPVDVPGVDLVATAEKMDELDGMLARLSVAPEVTRVGLNVAEEENKAQTNNGEEAREAMLV